MNLTVDKRWERKVAVGYVYGNIAPDFMASMTDLVMWDKATVKEALDLSLDRIRVARARLQRGETQEALEALSDEVPANDLILCNPRVGGCYVAQNRNSLVEEMLKTDAEVLAMFDADMVFGPSVLPCLLGYLDPAERPIIAGLYFAQVGDTYQFSWWEKCEDSPEYENITTVKPGLNRIDAFATGCCLIHRSVLERMREAYQDQWVWFAHDPIPGVVGNSYGEDISFGKRAQALGYPMYGVGDVVLGHAKGLTVTLSTYKDWQLLQRMKEKLSKNGPSIGAAEPIAANAR